MSRLYRLPRIINISVALIQKQYSHAIANIRQSQYVNGHCFKKVAPNGVIRQWQFWLAFICHAVRVRVAGFRVGINEAYCLGVVRFPNPILTFFFFTRTITEPISSSDTIYISLFIWSYHNFSYLANGANSGSISLWLWFIRNSCGR